MQYSFISKIRIILLFSIVLLIGMMGMVFGVPTPAEQAYQNAMDELKDTRTGHPNYNDVIANLEKATGHPSPSPGFTPIPDNDWRLYDAYVNLGFRYKEKLRYSDCITLLNDQMINKLTANSPSIPKGSQNNQWYLDAYLNIGYCAQKLAENGDNSKWMDAIKSYNSFIGIHKDPANSGKFSDKSEYSDVYFSLGYCYQMNQQYKEAWDAYKNYLSKYNNGKYVRNAAENMPICYANMTPKPTGVESVYGGYAASGGNADVKARSKLNLVELYLKNNRWSQAKTKATEVLAMTGVSLDLQAEAHNFLGIIYMQPAYSPYVIAKQHYNDIKIMNGLSQEWKCYADLNLAYISMLLPDYNTAILEYQQIISTYSSLPSRVAEAQYMIGECYYRKGPNYKIDALNALQNVNNDTFWIDKAQKLINKL